jgi:Spy/CpxP family protein refolding chaperone
MKHIITTIVAFVMFVDVAFAQNIGERKIENAKVALITNRLNLSTEQAQSFWPIYREYDTKQRELNKGKRKLIGEINTLTTTDDKILVDLKELQSLRQKEVDIEKEYMGKFLKVLNVRQLAELYKTEQVFTQMLLQRLNKKNNRQTTD